MDTCMYCQSKNLEQGIEVRADAASNLGLHYKKTILHFCVQQMYADLCKECGSINRFYVKNTDRKWFKDKN